MDATTNFSAVSGVAPTHDTEIDARVVRDLYQSIPAVVAVLITAILIFWTVMREESLKPPIDYWLLAMFTTAGARVLLWYLYRRRPQRLSARAWAWAYAGVAFTMGMSWSLVYLSVGDWNNLVLIVPTWMFLLGVMSAATATMWQHFPTFLAYTLPIAITGGVAIAAIGPREISWLGWALVLYYAVMVLLTRTTNRLYVDNIIIELSNRTLLERLEAQTRQQESIIEERTAALRLQQASLEHLANHDVLTGLPNRLRLTETLQQAIDDESVPGFTLLFIDLDQFKEINDSLGHSAGDQLLRTVAERLRMAVRQGDVIARLGGDEFTVFLPGLDDDPSARALTNKLLRALSAPMDIAGQRFVVTASIGICLYPTDGATAEALLRNADAAMYRAKRDGRNTLSRYSPEMTERSRTRLSLESELRDALTGGALSVAYQPQLDMVSGALVGAEALLRWEHETRGAVAPSEFIPIAEDTGLIGPLGYWVMEQVCEMGRTLAGDGRTGLSFAVNISARQLLDRDFDGRVRECLQTLAGTQQALEFEITETTLIQNPQRAQEIMAGLGELGVQFAVDDFGTGYSSLAYLKRYPIDKLKIDGSFVRDLAEDPSDRAIARAIIAMARSLSLQVIAEGVETAAQRDILVEDGCSMAQGFLFARPMTAGKFRGFTLAQSTKRSLH